MQQIRFEVDRMTERQDGKKCNMCGYWFTFDEGFYKARINEKIYYSGCCKKCIKVKREDKIKEGPNIQPKRKKRIKGQNEKNINNMQKEAAANGMSYGKYVAYKYLEREKGETK